MRAPLALPQQPLWLAYQLNPSNPASNRPVFLQLEGPLHSESLRRAVHQIQLRHQTLRTVFHPGGGDPVQVIQPASEIPWAEADLSGLAAESQQQEAQQRLRAEALHLFDLEQGPLLRGLLLRLSPERHLLGLFTHHIVFDGWSERVLLRELKELYAAFAEDRPAQLSELPIQYADFAAWQAERLAGGELQAQADYWRRQLAGAPSAVLPTSRITGNLQDAPAAVYRLEISPELTRQVREFSRRERVTLFMTLFAAFQLLLARYSGEDDVLTGTPAAGRTHLGTEPLIGCIMNLLPLRTRFGDLMTGLDLLSELRQTVLEAFSNQEIPFSTTAELLRTAEGPRRLHRLQTMFQLRNLPDAGAPEAAGVRFEPYLLDTGVLDAADLSLEVLPQGEALLCRLHHIPQAFESLYAPQFLEHYRNLLASLTAHPDEPVWTLDLLTAAERRRILIEWNSARAEYPANVCIHELFEQQAARNPDAVAAVEGSESISYRELDRHGNQIANALIRRGAGPEQRVVLCMDKSLSSLAGVLGVLKSGAAFVPLDPRLPQSRWDEILAEVEPAAILTETRTMQRFSSQPAPVLSLDSDFRSSTAHDDGKPAARVCPDNLAYILYTSGSTGRPKGVAIEHRHVVCFLHSFRPHSDEAEPRRGTSVSSLTFDLFIEEVFSCLCFGGTVHLLHPQQFLDPVYFARYLKEQRITTAYLYPDLLQPVARELKRLGGAPSFRTLITGLQPKKYRDLQPWRELDPALKILNAYGPTEVTYGATAYELNEGADPDGDVPIGKPFPNYSVYLLDAHRQPVPPGVVGEIHIGGPCVARDYWKRPEETRRAFLPDPFASQPGARMYKTGDLGRFLADGNLEFLGRADRQVKLRGCRIELEEIENALRSHPSVALAAVSEWEPAPGDKALAAYVVPQKGASLNKQALRSFLEQRLPHYMIPADWVFLEDLPRTASFKVDWRALPKPSRQADETTQVREEPLNETQAKLLAIWQQLLGTDRIGLDDDFFECGGHSLLAVRLFLELEKQLSVRLPPGVIFEAPTIRKLAQLLEEPSSPSLRALVPLRREGRRLPLFLVHAHEGSVFLYRRLAQRLGPDQPVYGLQAVTLDFGVETHPRFEDIAAEFVREIRSVQPRGPYCLAGFCAGAYLAFEAACQLQAKGERVALLGIINTPGDWRHVRSFADSLRYHGGILRSLPPAAIPIYLAERLRYRWLRIQDSSLRHALRLCRIQEFGRLPAWLRTSLLRDAHVRAARRYDPRRRFRGKLICLQATGDSMRDPLPYWGRLVEGEVVTLRVPGRGRSVLEEPHVAELAKALDALLEEANCAAGGSSQ